MNLKKYAVIFLLLLIPSSAWSRQARFEDIRDAFLKEDYRLVDKLSDEYRQKNHLEDVIYFKALSLLKMGRMMEARSQFRRLEEMVSDPEEKAAMSASVGDTYFYGNDFRTARDRYDETLIKYPASAQSAYLRGRISEIASKLGSKGLLNRLQNTAKSFFSVQVGSFSKEPNAAGLLKKLTRQSYPAYLEKEAGVYRVRVGQFSSRQEALALQSKLQKDGYPTRIYP